MTITPPTNENPPIQPSHQTVPVQKTSPKSNTSSTITSSQSYGCFLDTILSFFHWLYDLMTSLFSKPEPKETTPNTPEPLEHSLPPTPPVPEESVVDKENPIDSSEDITLTLPIESTVDKDWVLEELPKVQAFLKIAANQKCTEENFIKMLEKLSKVEDLRAVCQELYKREQLAGFLKRTHSCLRKLNEKKKKPTQNALSTMLGHLNAYQVYTLLERASLLYSTDFPYFLSILLNRFDSEEDTFNAAAIYVQNEKLPSLTVLSPKALAHLIDLDLGAKFFTEKHHTAQSTDKTLCDLLPKALPLVNKIQSLSQVPLLELPPGTQKQILDSLDSEKIHCFFTHMKEKHRYLNETFGEGYSYNTFSKKSLSQKPLGAVALLMLENQAPLQEEISTLLETTTSPLAQKDAIDSLYEKLYPTQEK